MTKKLKVAILQIENRDDPFFEFCININKSYCKLHDITHVFHRKGPSDICIYYWKVKVLLDMLYTTDYDAIVWMDSDAFVFKKDYDLRNFFTDNEDASMIIAGDPIYWASPKFMAAVFMVRNNKTSHEIFREWLRCFDRRKWINRGNDMWECMGCKWADSNYEQGAFVKYIMPLYEQHMKSVPWYYFHETNCKTPNPDCWSIHLPRPIKRLRPGCIVSEQTRYREQSTKILLQKAAIMMIFLIFITIIIFIIKKN